MRYAGRRHCGNVLDDREAFTRPPVPVSFEGETAPERMARRRRTWTPAVLREGSR
jgi:hypothetical protein